MTQKNSKERPSRSPYPAQTRERAVQMVLDIRSDHPSLWAAVKLISARIGCAPKTLLEWVQHSEVAAENLDVELETDRTCIVASLKTELDLELENERLRAENAVLRQACLIFARGPDEAKT